MSRFSKVFGINKSQAELDFVDINLDTDTPLFLDPFAITQRVDPWSEECTRTVMAFFQQVIDYIRADNDDGARKLLSNLREPNETRLGFSKNRPQGAGIGELQSEQVFKALKDSSAVKTGFLHSLEECELWVDGISRDKLSDLTTNVIRRHLIDYTQEQCKLHGVPTRQVATPAAFDPEIMEWVAQHENLPVYGNRIIVLVPKAIVRYEPAYEHGKYYNDFVLEYLQAEHVQAGSSLVRSFKNGVRWVAKKDLKEKFPCTKQFLYEFSKEHPEVLEEYRASLEASEKDGKSKEADQSVDELLLADSLARALKAIPGGDAHATNYHNLMVGVLEFIFFPHLTLPKKEQPIHDGRKRIDITMQNGAREGIFWWLRAARKLPCAYVAIECKNYTREVNNPELDQLSGRFSPHRGKVGILCCRQFDDRLRFIQRCKDTLGDDRGLILPLDDERIIEMLTLIQSGSRDKLDGKLSDWVREVHF